MDNVEKVARAMFRSAFGDDPLGDKAAEKLFEDHRFEYENLAQAALQSIGYERMRGALSEASAAIASLDADALGTVIDGDKAWPARDELLHRIDAALKGDGDRG